MSGHANFLPIGTNIPQPIINNVPAVDGNVNAANNVNNVPGGEAPQNRPLNFHWTTTVALDGTVTSTPIVVEPPPQAQPAANP